jgi:hypothetical protein
MMVAPREPYHCACFLAHVEWSEGVISHAAGDVRVVAALNRYGATRSGSRLAGAGGACPGRRSPGRAAESYWPARRASRCAAAQPRKETTSHSGNPAHAGRGRPEAVRWPALSPV